MSDEVTKTMLSVYEQVAQPVAFFSGMFQARPENFFATKDVELDIVRSEEDVAFVVQDMSTGYNYNSADEYTNKKFPPPVFKEAVALDSFTLMNRMPGADPFQSPNFRANIVDRMFKTVRPVESKIRRAIELQASQILQTGKVSLTDGDGNALYTLDFKPKTSHFTTAGVAWSSSSSTKAANILALANEIRSDGLHDVDELLMGESAWELFIADDDIKARYETRRLDQGTVSPMQKRGNGGIYRGTVEIGNYHYDIWTYGGRYKHPQTGVSTKFLADDKVVVRSSTARMDACFGAIPNIGKELGVSGAQILPEVSGRFSSELTNIDLFTNVWLSPDGEQLIAGMAARPLMIPTALDTFGCLDINI